MKVGFLYDSGNADGTLGGAELTMGEFESHPPDGVEVVKGTDADVVVVGNCVTIDPRVIGQLEGKRVIRYHNDLAYHEAPKLRAWLNANAEHVFTSPLHLEKHELDEGQIIPPALELARFHPPRQTRRNAKRSGAVTIGAWQNPGKGQVQVCEWSERNEPVDVYGTGEIPPLGPTLDYKGPLRFEDVPQTLWRYETFVHLPTAIEPFGRTVVEAHAAGCTVVTNQLVGARYFLEHDPDALEHANEAFWELVCG